MGAVSATPFSTLAVLPGDCVSSYLPSRLPLPWIALGAEFRRVQIKGAESRKRRSTGRSIAAGRNQPRSPQLGAAIYPLNSGLATLPPRRSNRPTLTRAPVSLSGGLYEPRSAPNRGRKLRFPARLRQMKFLVTGAAGF